MRPPELIEIAEPTYPPEEMGAPREAEVGLKLTINAAGQVEAAEVTHSAGAHFDAAARAAALALRFSPAQRDGEPVGAKILFKYRFRPPPPVVLASEAPNSVQAQPLPSPQPASGQGAVEQPARRLSAASQPAATKRARTAARSDAAIEVMVQGLTRADVLRQSAEAVQVVEVEREKRRSADLGEVLARSEGIAVQRSGGLGSVARFSLNGLTDDQVRFFVDGVPLELTGHLFGISNFPVEWVQQVEVYRGVVPARFAIDALGGAVNVATDGRLAGTHGAASYQVGSYGTYRLSAGAQHRHAASGLFMRVNAYADDAKNDYPVRATVPQLDGSEVSMDVRRFHDAYRARFVGVEAGVVNRPWARRLSLRAFASTFDKELQHNIIMSVPYGEVSYGRDGGGAQTRFERDFGKTHFETTLAYARARGWFKDLGRCVYSWLGRCLAPLNRPGEIEPPGRDSVYWDDSIYAVVRASWQPSDQQQLRIATSAKGLLRNGKDHLITAGDKDPLSADRRVFSFVTGLEYQVDLFEGRLQNILFGKQYTQVLRSEEPVVRDVWRRRDRETVRFGAGDSVRLRIVDALFAKASYELATRLASAEEIFGDAALVNANLELAPEASHNVNLGLQLSRGFSSGSYRAELNTFLRDSDQLIVRLGNESHFRHQNVFRARTLGAEASATWTSPRDILRLSANATYVDRRNASAQGTFGDYKGDRIPNQPYLFGNGSAELRFTNGDKGEHQLSIFFNSRYVHSYYRGWESLGDEGQKASIPSQLVHTAAITYWVRRPLSVSSTFEIQNLTDAEFYDFYGVPRPGRSYFFRGSAEF